MKHKAIIVWFVLGAGFCLGTIATVNRTVDPARLFSSGEQELGAATALAERRYVVGAAHLDVRLMQRYLTVLIRRQPGVLILGSSRSWEIGSNIFPLSRTLNQSLPAADFDDMEGLLAMWRARKLLPKKVVMGIDPWMLNQARTTGLGYVKPSIAYDGDINTATSSKPLTWRSVKAMFSLQYFFDSFRAWRSRTGSADGITYRLADSDDSDHDVLRPDGTFKNRLSAFERPVAEVEFAAARHGRDKAFWGLENFSAIDQAALAKFDALLDLLQTNGTKVVIFLPPYYPAAYRTIQAHEKYRMVLVVESTVRSIAKKRGLTVVGSYDPVQANCSNAEFFDHHHPHPSCVKRAFRMAPL